MLHIKTEYQLLSELINEYCGGQKESVAVDKTLLIPSFVFLLLKTRISAKI